MLGLSLPNLLLMHVTHHNVCIFSLCMLILQCIYERKEKLDTVNGHINQEKKAEVEFFLLFLQTRENTCVR